VPGAPVFYPSRLSPPPPVKGAPLQRGAGLGAGQAASATLSPPSRPRGYKSYTLADFKDLSLDIKLGGLGPDLENEERRAKEENNARVRALAAQIRAENAAKILAQPHRTKEAVKEPSVIDRQKAFQAKIPKPRVRPAASATAGAGAGAATGEEEEPELVPQRMAGSSAVTLVPRSKSPERSRGLLPEPAAIAGRTAAAAATGRRGGAAGTAAAPAAEDELQAQLQRQQAQRRQVDKMRKQMGV